MKNNKKIILILLVFLAIVLFFAINNGLLQKEKSQTIEQILNIDFNNISSIKIENEAIKYDLDRFKNEYKNNRYIKYNGSIGSTTHQYIRCYDKNNNLLFTIIDIGNNDLFYIYKGSKPDENSKNNLYQLDKQIKNERN